MAVDQEPTRSQQTNRLIALCQAVAAGEKDAGELRKFLEERRKGLEAMKADFISRFEAEGETFQQAFRQDMEAVVARFDEHGIALDEIALYFEDKDPAHLEGGIEILVEGTPHLLEALENYETKFVVAGPTQYPMLNILLRMVPAMKEGRVPEAELRQMLEAARENFQKIVAEIDASPEKDSPSLPQRRAAFQRVLDGLATMLGFFTSRDASALDQGLEILEEAHRMVADALQAYQEANFTGGPTPSPMANWVLAAARGVKAGTYPPQILKDAVAWMTGEMTKIRESFEQTASTPTTSTALQDELPKTMEAFDLVEEALEELQDAAEAGTSPDPGMEKLQAAVGKLHDSQAFYAGVGEREGKRVCPQCQLPNAPGNRRCEKCGFALPRMMDEAYSAGGLSTFEFREAQQGPGTEDQMVMTTHLQRLFQAAEAFHAGQAEAEEFAQVLDWAEGLLDDGETRMQGLVIPEAQGDLSDEDRAAFEEQRALAVETRDLLGRGLEEFRTGLNQMRQCLETRSQDTMVAGIRSVWEGARKLHQCQRMGEMVSEGGTGGPDEAAPGGDQVHLGSGH